MKTILYGSMLFWARCAVWWKRLFGFVGSLGFWLLAGLGFFHYRLLVWYLGPADAMDLLLKAHPGRREELRKELEAQLERLKGGK